MNANIKKTISKGALGFAVVAGPVAAFTGLTDMPISELWVYTFMGTFLLAVFLHWFFRDENFDKVEVIRFTITISLLWLAILFFYAFAVEAYLAMFVCLGLFTAIYLIYLLIGVLNVKAEDIN